jgi:chaperonin GroES
MNSMAINLKPLGDRVVVEPLEQEDMTASGLVIPDTAKEKPQKGTVVAAGPGARDEQGKRVALDVSVGETVLFAKYAGTEFKLDSKKLLILKENDLLAIVEGDKLVGMKKSK